MRIEQRPVAGAALLAVAAALLLFATLATPRVDKIEPFLVFTSVGPVTLGVALGALLAGGGAGLLYEAPHARRVAVGLLLVGVGLVVFPSATWQLAAIGLALVGVAAVWYAPWSVPIAFGALAASFGALEAFHGLMYALKSNGGAPAEAWRLLFTPPFSLARVLGSFTVAFVLVGAALMPVVWLETRAIRAFARREVELREARPLDVMTPYDGEEGQGVAFDGPDARLLLLHPPHGIGAPREVTVAREPEFPSPTPSSLPTGE